ncbi:FKBP-type peptidyl-prolyl cis-trans isomerase [Hymenobacter pini]|uniref:FKBP-type peptidyl-prolyl cis-trans isomerase n=1 Tax=Hymenobacter pini TaxID=2880879 RepID=UPI001CF2A1C8|nr:FKBP-type peptidyl-prolyl cis-trans isomerase [Hymenobacter pini]MCA8832808.1 FKBP-type peptidyl-prolyl cis-trans isomerase [Hymenobacter pini]
MKKFVLNAALLLAGFSVPALTSCNTEPSYVKQAREVEEAQKKTDDSNIQAYLTRRAITNYTRLESGIYLIPITDGPASNPLIKAGQKVTTNYVGRFMLAENDGLVFDASSNNHTTCGCLGFINGSGQLVKGWDQATLQMRKGDRKIALIPSYLLLTSSGGFLINASTYQPLAFDIEILNVE